MPRGLPLQRQPLSQHTQLLDVPCLVSPGLSPRRLDRGSRTSVCGVGEAGLVCARGDLLGPHRSAVRGLGWNDCCRPACNLTQLVLDGFGGVPATFVLVVFPSPTVGAPTPLGPRPRLTSLRKRMSQGHGRGGLWSSPLGFKVDGAFHVPHPSHGLPHPCEDSPGWNWCTTSGISC